MTAHSFSLDVTWIDGSSSTVQLQFCPGKGGEHIVSGIAMVNQKDQTASYLTQLPTKLAQRSDRSLSVPGEEIDLALSVTTKGVEVSFWILEFAGEQQVAKTSWPVQRDKVVRWKPHADCNSIRLAWRLRGSGSLDHARVVAQEAGLEDQKTARWMATWHALNVTKSALHGEIEPTAECPSQLGPKPTSLAPAAVATHPFFEWHGLDTERFEIDGDPIVVPEYQTVWPFLQRAIAERHYEWRSPFTGETLRSSDAVIVSEPAGRPYVFVRFESAGQVMFLILSAFRSSRVGVYFPVEDIVVSRLNLGTLVCALRSLVVRNAGAVHRYLTTTEPRRLIIPLNTMSHWGHVMLNELDALQWLFDSGTAASIDLWILGEVGFFEVDKLFDEIPRDRLIRAMSTEERFRTCLEHNAMVIRPQIASYFLGEKAGTRLVEHWRREDDGSIAAKLEGRFPVLWCEVRANDRLWTNQREGLVAIVDKLRPKYPNLAIVFAGWSRMLDVRADDEKMITVEHQVLTSLAEVLGVECIPVLGVPTGEKMRWALACDFHLSIVGSGMLFPLLARIPGVTVSSRYYQENDLFLGDPERQANWMYGLDRMVVVPKQFVTDDAAITNAEVRNFSVDPQALADLVDAHLAREVQR